MRPFGCILGIGVVVRLGTPSAGLAEWCCLNDSSQCVPLPVSACERVGSVVSTCNACFGGGPAAVDPGAEFVFTPALDPERRGRGSDRLTVGRPAFGGSGLLVGAAPRAQQPTAAAGPAHGMAFTGACCHEATATCVDDQTADACFGGGGSWYQCATCDDIACPPLAACCDTTTASCTEGTTAEGCFAMGGTLWGAETCAEVPCSSTGACCHLFSGACTDGLTIDQCLGQGFEYAWGAGVTCAEAPCMPPSGACCDFGTGLCADDVGVFECFGWPSPGRTCAEVPCPPTGACCDLLANSCMEDATEPECLAVGGWWSPDATCAEAACPNCAPPGILSSQPPDAAVDARQPTAPDGSDPTGWDRVELTFAVDMAAASAADFAVATAGAPPPVIEDVLAAGQTVTVVFDGAVPPGSCTTITHLPSATGVHLGYLPGDVDGDGSTTARDILTLIDHLNAALDASLQMWQCDMDRSGSCDAQDVLRLVDLLGGAEQYDRWNGAVLPACP